MEFRGPINREVSEATVGSANGQIAILGPNPPNSTETPLTDPEYTDLNHENCPWGRKTVLTLDGGGIRGYSSLLILQRIMHEIEGIERTHPDGAHYSSFDYPWRGEPNPSDVDGQYLPCHYFDYVAGTSTGGLSAIMLGRLRMGIQAALSAYTEFGNEVFGKSRYWHINSALWYPRSKYASSPMEKVFLELISRHLGIRDPWEATIERLESPEDQTRTIAFSWRQSPSVSVSYLWRSYDNSSRTGGQDSKFHLNLGRAASTPIWEVARATSAAPRYFEPIVISQWTHVDGALGANNPSPKTINEVYYKENGSVPALSLSIGTGVDPQEQQEGMDFSQDIQRVLRDRKNNKLRRRQILRKYWELLTGVTKQITNTEEDTINWERDCGLIQKAGYPNVEEFDQWWHRLNVDNTLKAIPLDDWTPRKGGQETLKQITDLTDKYLAKRQVQESIRRIAEALVEKRRKRVRTEKWEHFIMKVAYRCPWNKVHNEHFNSREDLRTHLQAKHSNLPVTDEDMHTLLNTARVVPSPSQVGLV